jgi:hypothetical protein
MENPNRPDFYKYDANGVEDYRYATNIVVTNTNREFFISFVCDRPYETPKCVSRLIVGEAHMKEIIAILGRQLETYLKNNNGKQEPAGESDSKPDHKPRI